MSRDGWAALPHVAIGLSAFCDCDISWSYSLFFMFPCGVHAWFPSNFRIKGYVQGLYLWTFFSIWLYCFFFICPIFPLSRSLTLCPKYEPHSHCIILLSPGVTHSVTLHSSHCNRMGYAWAYNGGTPGLTRMKLYISKNVCIPNQTYFYLDLC